MKLLTRLFHPTRLPFTTESRIIEAFTCGGTNYYQFDDAFNMPNERALTALTYYEELRMRCTREFLQEHCEAIEGILSDPKRINIPKLAILNRQLKERLDWIFEPDIAYKLASVVYFDKTENPYRYDMKYGQKKIEHWKKTKGVDDFFLQKPLLDLIPFLKDSELNLEIYSQVLEKATKIMWDNISGKTSAKRKQENFAKN